MNDSSEGRSAQAFVTSAAAVAQETWDDARGRIAFHTLVGGGTTPSNHLVAGFAIVEPGGSLARHRHAPAEIYHVLGGAGTVTIEGVARTLGKTRTAFMLEASRRAAEEALSDQTAFPVSRAAYARFLERLDAPPEPNERLKRTMRSTAPWERG